MKNILAFFDRNFNLLFRGHRCVKIIFYGNFFRYNDIIVNEKGQLRCLGKSWYLMIKK